MKRFTLALDLDGTLIPEREPFAIGLESGGGWAWLLGAEPLRQGTRALAREAKRRNWSLWVYTSSMRSVLAVRLLFLAHGVWLDGVINDQRHREGERRANRRWPSKYPPAFGIDLLIDNERELRRVGRRHGFSVLLLKASDRAWVRRVLRAAERNARSSQQPAARTGA